MDSYEEKCKPSDFPLIEESLEEFYRTRRIYFETKKFSDKVIAENEMYSVFFQAKGYMSMGYISQEKFQFIKQHLEAGITDD